MTDPKPTAEMTDLTRDQRDALVGKHNAELTKRYEEKYRLEDRIEELERRVAELQRSEVYWAEQFRTAKGAAERNERENVRLRKALRKITLCTHTHEARSWAIEVLAETEVTT